MTLRERLVQFDQFRSEATIALCSVWASVFMFWYPTDFDKFPRGGLAYDLMQSIAAHERWWAWFVLIAALTKVSGLLALADFSLWGLSIVLRKVGLTMSFIWWTILGVSSMVGGYFILGFLPIVVGATSAWLVLAEMALPNE